MKLLTQPPLQPEHWHGTKASQPKAPTSFDITEVPMTPSHTSVMNFLQGTYYPGGQKITTDISHAPQSISRSKDSALLPQGHSKPCWYAAPTPKRCLFKEEESVSTMSIQLRGRAFGWQVKTPWLNTSGPRQCSIIKVWRVLETFFSIPIVPEHSEEIALWGCFILDGRLKS